MAIVKGVVHPSGTSVSVFIKGATLPLLPAFDAKGFTLQTRSDSRKTWSDQIIAGVATIAGDSVNFGLQNPIPARSQARLLYNAIAGNIIDSALPKPNSMASQPSIPLTNNSTADTNAVSRSGLMFLSTRGFARTCADVYHTNQEAQTLHRQEMPYGASAGWVVPYQGFSDTTNDSVVVIGAAAWIQQSTREPIVRLPLKFSGKAGTTISGEAIVESDPISIPLLPGAVVWVTTWYKCGLAATGLPYQTLIYTKESIPGAEDRDGTLAGLIGTLTDHTLTGGFDHSTLEGALSAGLGYLARGYRPMAIVGKPHPSFTGASIVPIWLGDSINVQQNDFIDDDTIYCMRGFNGRFCASTYPYIVFGQGGSNSGGFMSAVGTPLFNYIFGSDAAHSRKVTHAVNEYGINSMRMDGKPDEIAAHQWADRERVAALLHDVNVPYIHTTITPCEQGWTNWQTDAGGPKDAAFAIFVQQRQAFNEMVRTKSASIPGCIGFIDPCSTLETDPKTGSNQWLLATKSDGIHPNSVGHQAYAGTIPMALFIDHPNPIPLAK